MSPLHGSNTSLTYELGTQEAKSNAYSFVETD